MKKVTTLAMAALLGLSVAATSAMADQADIGQRVYLQAFADACGMNGTKFAAQHSQVEWEEILEDGLFESRMIEICGGNIEAVPERFIPALFDFVHKYANDSGNVPSC